MARHDPKKILLQMGRESDDTANGGDDDKTKLVKVSMSLKYSTEEEEDAKKKNFHPSIPVDTAIEQKSSSRHSRVPPSQLVLGYDGAR